MVIHYNFKEDDENANTKMYDRNMKLLSENYFAYKSFSDEVEEIVKGDRRVTYVSPEIAMIIEQKRGETECY